MHKTSALKSFAWSLSGLVVVVALIGWGQGLHWRFAHLSIYNFFPVLGLAAFGLMWSHYIVSAVRQYLGIEKAVLRAYIEITGWIVLILIILHPGLLEWQLFKDGLGLPPGSILNNYVSHSLKIFAIFGFIGLFAMLAYELRRWFNDKAWWQYVGYAIDAAMLMLFIHGLKLGRNLQHGWLRIVWIFYGISLIFALWYSYNKKFSKPDIRHSRPDRDSGSQ